jgi:hypothetical protein
MLPAVARTVALIATLGLTAYAADQAPAKEAAAKPYPLDYCIVSGDKLGEEGKPVTVVKDGQEFKLCCKDCIKDLDKDPKKFEDKLAAALKDGADHHDHGSDAAHGHDDHDQHH